ncbi:MAG: hypothetical protein JSR98_17235 [Proteobacteria bacterium]|nr:hypothetical protein [Pseudomonadota bacterium]
MALDVAQGWPLAVLVWPGAQFTAPEVGFDFLPALLEPLELGEVAAVSSLEVEALLALEDGSVVLLGGVVAEDSGGIVFGAAPGRVGAAGLAGGLAGLGAWAAAAPAMRRLAPKVAARRWPDRSMGSSRFALRVQPNRAKTGNGS